MSRQNCPLLLVFDIFLYSKQHEVLGTPASRPLFVLPGVPGTLSRGPEDFLKFIITCCASWGSRFLLDAAFLLTLGGFLLTVSFLLTVIFLSFLLTI